MGEIRDQFNVVYRDYETDGVPSSGLHEPEKADIRALGTVIENGTAASAADAAASASVAMQAAVQAQGTVGTLATAVSVGGALPFEVTGLTITAAGSGATSTGWFAGGVSGGPAGFAWSYFLSGGVVTQVRIDAKGIATTNTAPTLTLPSGDITGATITPTVSALAAGRIFLAPNADGSQLLGWQSSGGVIAAWNVGGIQYATYQKSGIDAVVPSTYETLVSYAGLLLLDAGGRIIGQVPDPAVATLFATAATSSIYETTDTSVTTYILDAGGRIVASLGGTGTVGSEVATARGNQVSLTARLDPSITPDGAPIVNPYRPQLLRHARYRLTKLSLPTPEAVLMGISAGGDSYTHNASRWIGAFADKMTAKFGDAGMGFTGFGFLPSGNVAPWTSGNQPTYLNGNARPSKYPCRLYGNIVGTYYTAKAPDLAMATLSASGDAIEIDFPAGHPNTVGKLLYVATAGAAARVTTNGGSTWTALDLSIGTAGALTTMSITPPAGAATMRIEWVSGTCPISGAFARGTTGVYVSKIAATGSRVSQFATASATNWETGFAALEPHLFIYMDGTNSQGAGVADSTWGGDLATVVTRARSSVPAIDVLIATPPENQRTTNTVPMTVYPVEARKRAQALRFSFTDMQDVFGDPTNPTEYGSSGAIPLFASDLIHPDPTTGGRSLCSQMLNAVVPYVGA